MNNIIQRWGIGACICLFAWSATSALAGVAVQGRFDETGAGWTERNNPSGIQWAYEGHLEIEFPAAGDQPPLPGTYASLSMGSQFADGSFAGNYQAAGVSIIGFDFRADTALPRNGLTIELHSGDQYISRDLLPRIRTLGEWQRIVVRLDDRKAGGWYPEDDALFDEVLADVDYVRLYVGHSYTGGAAYHVDNLFLGRLHSTADMRVTEDGRPRITWDGLLDLGPDASAATVYRIQTTTDLSSNNWQTVEIINNYRNGVIEWTLPDAAQQDEESGGTRFYRLIMD